MLRKDPIEDTEEYKKAMERIQPELDEFCENVRGRGSCHSIWRKQKELLSKQGIDWKSPKEMNPSVMFD